MLKKYTNIFFNKFYTHKWNKCLIINKNYFKHTHEIANNNIKKQICN